METHSDPDTPEEPLSPREHEILDLIARGRSNYEITQQLYLSINTVKTYIRSTYTKIGVTTRVQAVLWALGHGFGDGTLGPTGLTAEDDEEPASTEGHDG